MDSSLHLYQRNPNFIYRNIVGEAILVPMHQDVADMESIYTLNEAGAFIWECLKVPASKAEVQATFLEAYDAEPDIVAADLERFIDELVAIGALRQG